MESLSVKDCRRLALARAGLLKPEWTGLPRRAAGRGVRAHKAAHAIVDRFGYLQLDTVSIAGTRSHAIVLLSRLEGLHPEVGEELLRPGAPLFEYWGHEASWIPMSMYPAFGFRRREFKDHPWWGPVVKENPGVAEKLRRRIRDEGPIRSAEMEGRGSRGWWDLKVAKKVASALWSSGELAIRERRHFQRSYDLAARVIPAEVRAQRLSDRTSLETLLLKALDGHGWASAGTLASTWRLVRRTKEVHAALDRLAEKGEVIECELGDRKQKRKASGWIRPRDLELADRLRTARPARDRGVLLSPFDPVLWDRVRVQRLFDFDQILEIFKPAPQRTYGYYCLPVLAGERLVARFDLKADRAKGRLNVLSCRFEGSGTARPETAADQRAAQSALERYSAALELKATGWRHG